MRSLLVALKSYKGGSLLTVLGSSFYFIDSISSSSTHILYQSRGLTQRRFGGEVRTALRKTATQRQTTTMWRNTTLYSVVVACLAVPTTSFAFWNSLSVPNTYSSQKTRNVPKSCRILILPGFGNASEDYSMDNSLVSSLVRRGWDTSQIDVLDVKRSDWLLVFLRGALDVDFWRAQAAPTKPAFAWYLERIASTVNALEEDESVILLGHSAGGWLARAALGFGSQPDVDSLLSIDLDRILGLVTLGAPNQPPPLGVMDMTRGALKMTNEQFPGAFHAPSMFYVTVIGRAVQGKKQTRKTPFEPTSMDGFAFQSYEAVCGDGGTIGDGVVPLCAAHLDDAIQLDLQGVFHSINVPDQWYGSDKVLDRWHETVLDEVYKLTRRRAPTAGAPFSPFFQ